MVKSTPSRLVEAYKYVYIQKNSNCTKYTIKPLILQAQFIAAYEIKGKIAKKGIL
jgi:hypothetical protein